MILGGVLPSGTSRAPYLAINSSCSGAICIAENKFENWPSPYSLQVIMSAEYPVTACVLNKLVDESDSVQTFHVAIFS